MKWLTDVLDMSTVRPKISKPPKIKPNNPEPSILTQRLSPNWVIHDAACLPKEEWSKDHTTKVGVQGPEASPQGADEDGGR